MKSISGLGQATGNDQAAVLRKPHEIIVMVAKSATVTTTARRIYMVLLQFSQLRLRELQDMPPADFLFEAPLLVVLKATGSDGEARSLAKKYLTRMQRIVLDWESTAPGDGVKWRAYSMLSEVVLELRQGQNWVSWTFPPSIMAALRDTQRWASIDLAIIAKLDSYAAICLYEICARYRENSGGSSSRKPPEWWTDALCNGPGNSRREWRKFKYERIKPAIAEINSKSDLIIELIEHKKGGKLVEVQFSISSKLRDVQDEPNHGPIDTRLAARAQMLGINEPKLEGLIREFTQVKVDFHLRELERRRANTSLKPVENAYSYLRSLLLRTLDNMPRSVTDAELAAPAAPAKALPGREPKPLTADSPRQGERLAMLMKELQGLSEIQRRRFLSLAVQDLSTRGLLTGAVSKRAVMGEIKPGVLGSKAVEFYAETTYGVLWRLEGA